MRPGNLGGMFGDVLLNQAEQLARIDAKTRARWRAAQGFNGLGEGMMDTVNALVDKVKANKDVFAVGAIAALAAPLVLARLKKLGKK